MSGGRKRKVSLTLDADLLDSLDVPPRALSATVNELLRAGWEEQQYQRDLTRLAERLYIQYGLDNPEDEADLARLARIGKALEDAQRAQAAS